jgi:phosphoglycolate phosphatase
VTARDSRSGGLPWDILVFDLDGTLVESSGDITRALNRMLAEKGGGSLARRDVVPLLGEGVTHLVTSALAIAGLDPDERLVSECASRYRRFYAEEPVRDSYLYPGVTETLEALARTGVRMGVCTNKDEDLAREVLTLLGVVDHFVSVVGGDRLAVRKPDPAHLLTAVEEAGGSARNSALVGDSAIDVECARRAGVTCYVVGWAAPDLPEPRLAEFTDLVGLRRASPTPTPPHRSRSTWSS